MTGRAERDRTFRSGSAADHRVGFARMIHQRSFIAFGAIVLVQNRNGLDPFLFASLYRLHEIDSGIAGPLHHRNRSFRAQSPRQSRAPQSHFLFLFEAIVISARQNNSEKLELAPVPA